MNDVQALAELAAREPIFHPPPATRAELDALVVDDFWEVGASGNVYDKDTIWAVVRRRPREDTHEDTHEDTGEDPGSALRTADFAVRRLGPDTWLLTYRLWQGARQTRRASVWRHDGGRWIALYHQGTPVEPVPAQVERARQAQADPAG